MFVSFREKINLYVLSVFILQKRRRTNNYHFKITTFIQKVTYVLGWSDF